MTPIMGAPSTDGKIALLHRETLRPCATNGQLRQLGLHSRANRRSRSRWETGSTPRLPDPLDCLPPPTKAATACLPATFIGAMRIRPLALPSIALPSVIPGYTGDVKTAISLPDDTYAQATRRAAELGISRSEFFARAARRYLDDLASQSLTQQIDEALQAAADDSNAAAAAAGRSFLADQDEW